ncbi:hypothetical protein DB346_02270 [Verrucomicrobia bacterium LW23]|nr:hypothetical protein DB346_02270 [Verrucomicrobia bacterium LW23]
MPSTFHGIGSTYSGKENAQTRMGFCKACKAWQPLESYDTKLCACFLYIPLFTLGKKHVLDQCPACTNHFSIPKDEWDKQCATVVQNAAEAYNSEPTPENAIAVHHALLELSQIEQAAQFRQSQDARFGNNAMVLAFFGHSLRDIGRTQDANPLFDRAYDLDPALPAARVGVFYQCLAKGELDDARLLLDFLERPGAGNEFSLEPLGELASALAAKGRHEAALELYAVILRELPELGKDAVFRARVKKSEKALGRHTSMLPERDLGMFRMFSSEPVWDGGTLSWRTVTVVGLIGLVLFALLLGVNEYFRTHRSVYVVNGLPGTIVAKISGADEVLTVAEQGEPAHWVVPEGKHRVTISGAFTAEYDVDLTCGYFERFLERPLWIVNPDGAALIIESTQTIDAYSGGSSVYTSYFGTPISRFEGIEYPFKELPEKINLGRSRSKVINSLLIASFPLAYLDVHCATPERQTEYFRLINWMIRRDPANESLLDRYHQAVLLHPRERDIFDTTLKQGLERRPISIPWHRTYWSMASSSERTSELRAMYDELLQREDIQKSPTELAAVLYLRGDVDPVDPRPWWEKSLQADNNRTEAASSLAERHMALGEWQRALDVVGRLTAESQTDGDTASVYLACAIAQGNAEKYETGLRAKLKESPGHSVSAYGLTFLLALKGENDAAEKLLKSYGKELEQYGPLGEHFYQLLSFRAHYAMGDFDHCLAEARMRMREKPDILKVPEIYGAHALMEMGRTDEARALYSFPLTINTTTSHLFIDLAYRAEGKPEKAAQIEKDLISVLKNGSPRQVAMAALLESATAPDIAAMRNMGGDLEVTATLYAVLGCKFPEKSAEYFAEARKINILPVFPYYLIARVAGKEKEKAAAR